MMISRQEQIIMKEGQLDVQTCDHMIYRPCFGIRKKGSLDITERRHIYTAF